MTPPKEIEQLHKQIDDFYISRGANSDMAHALLSLLQSKEMDRLARQLQNTDEK